MYFSDEDLRREEAQAKVDAALDKIEDAMYSSDEARQEAQLRRVDEALEE